MKLSRWNFLSVTAGVTLAASMPTALLFGPKIAC
jgi:hypothetical protein